MRKHSLLGVLALAMLLAVAGSTTLSAGNLKGDHASDGQGCVMQNGQCVPCPKGGGPCVPCPSGQGCGKAASCSPGSCKSEAGYTMTGVRDANSGQLVVYRVPTATARMILAGSTPKSADPAI